MWHNATSTLKHCNPEYHKTTGMTTMATTKIATTTITTTRTKKRRVNGVR